MGWNHFIRILFQVRITHFKILCLSLARCKANRGEWTPLPKKFADGLKCEKPKPKCTNKDRDRLFPVTGTGSWSCTETDDSEEKESHLVKKHKYLIFENY